MTTFLKSERDGAVLTLTMSQPETRNALTGNSAVEEFVQACAAIAQNRSIRVVILTAEGPVFSSGGNARVLGYAPVAAWLARAGRDAAAVLGAFDAQVQWVDAAPRARCRCSDPDDQMFVDLAVARGVPLLSKDRALLALRRPLAALGVAVHPPWPWQSFE